MLKGKIKYSLHTFDTLLKLFHVIWPQDLQLFCSKAEVRQDTFVDHDAIKLEMKNPKLSIYLGYFLKIYTLISKCFVLKMQKTTFTIQKETAVNTQPTQPGGGMSAPLTTLTDEHPRSLLTEKFLVVISSNTACTSSLFNHYVM